MPPRNAIRARAAPLRHAVSGAVPGACSPTLAFLRPRPFPPHPPPPLITALFGASSVLRAHPTPHPFPDGLPLGTRHGPGSPGRLRAGWGLPGSDGFRSCVMGLQPRQSVSASHNGAHMLPSALSTASASAGFCLSRLNSPPRTIAVYASRGSSPSAPQHSLPSARYGLLGPDLHRLDPASFAWRTDSSASFARSCSVSTRSAKRERRTRHETVSCTVTGHPECPRKPTYRIIRSPRTARNRDRASPGRRR